MQTGEGVNDVRKGACARHVSTMAGFLKVSAAATGPHRACTARFPPGASGIPHNSVWMAGCGQRLLLLLGRCATGRVCRLGSTRRNMLELA